MRKYPENNLRAIRKKLGLTLEQVAERIQPQTGHDMIQKLEMGNRELTHTWMLRLQKVYHCDINEFFEMKKTKKALETNKLQSDIQRESDVALMYVLKMIFHLLIKHQVVSPEGLDFNFTEALNHYHKKGWIHAAHLIEGFRTFVTEEPHQLEKVAIQRLLELAPLGSA